MAKTSVRAGMPYAHEPIAEYLSKQIDITVSLGKNQREIASEIGYDKPNMISMFKRGEAKVPLEKIPSLAKALNVDPAFMFRLGLQQYWPGAQKAIADIFGTVLTKNEAERIEYERSLLKGEDVRLTPDLQRKLKAAFKD